MSYLETEDKYNIVSADFSRYKIKIKEHLEKAGLTKEAEDFIKIADRFHEASIEHHRIVSEFGLGESMDENLLVLEKATDLLAKHVDYPNKVEGLNIEEEFKKNLIRTSAGKLIKELQCLCDTKTNFKINNVFKDRITRCI